MINEGGAREDGGAAVNECGVSRGRGVRVATLAGREVLVVLPIPTDAGLAMMAVCIGCHSEMFAGCYNSIGHDCSLILQYK